MATQGRDVTIGILTDTSQFDVEQPAKELEELGATSTETARDVDKVTDELKRLAAQGKDAQRELDRLNAQVADNNFEKMGRDAKVTAAKVDDAFDSIARSARTNFDKVDKEVREAGREGFKGLKEEAGESGREAAQSFDGTFGSVIDFVQETAAQAFSGFGPVGAAAGVAAALGIGLITKAFGDAQEAAQHAREAVAGWASDIIDAQGQITNAVVTSKLRDLFASEENTDKLHDMRVEAQRAGVDFVTYARAVSGSAEAQEDLKRQWLASHSALAANNDITTQNNAALADQRKGLEEVADRAGINNKQMAEGTRNAEDYAKATGTMTDADREASLAAEEHQRALEGIAGALDDAADPLDTYQSLLDDKMRKEQESAQKTADTTKSTTDSWQDFVKPVKVSLGEFMTELTKSVTASEAWAANLKTLAARGVDEGILAELARMGPEAAPLVAQLATSTDPELKKFVGLMHRQGAASTTALAEGITEKAPDVSASVSGLQTTIDSSPLHIPLYLDPVDPVALRNAQRTAQQYYNQHPVTVPVKPDITGTGKGVI